MMLFIDRILALIMTGGDALFGWILYLPSVVAIGILGIITSALMALVRRWTTDQDLLGRAHADKSRLKVLIREAKRAGDKEALPRYRATNGAIALKLMVAEWKPLLAAIIPIAFIGTWAWYRLGYVPLRADEPVVLELSLPPSEIGELVWLLPQDGITLRDGAVQEVVPGNDPAMPHGIARWTLSGSAATQPHLLTLRSATATWNHPLLVGQTISSDPIVFHDPEAALPQSHARLDIPPILGFIPGPRADSWGGWGALFPSWVITYIILVLPLFILGKKVFRLR